MGNIMRKKTENDVTRLDGEGGLDQPEGKSLTR